MKFERSGISILKISTILILGKRLQSTRLVLNGSGEVTISEESKLKELRLR